jgi:hypothetical protein
MSKKFVDEEIGLAITYYLPKQHAAKYLVVVLIEERLSRSIILAH